MANYDPTSNFFILEDGEIDFAVPAFLPGTTTPTPADAHIQGNALSNTLTGDATNNLLNSGGGGDTLIGGLGNDIYVVFEEGDVVEELADQGMDYIYSSVSYALPGHVEWLELMGSTNLNGFGNDTANTLVGNDSNNLLWGNGGNDTVEGWNGNDTLGGGEGLDTLVGGIGDDVYHIDDGDSVIELAGEGFDTIIASYSAELSDNTQVEELQAVAGTAALSLSGGNMNDILIGNLGHNVLNGRTGDDTMKGSAGNDTYHVDSGSDSIVETGDNGIDAVITSVNYALTAYVENLSATGTAALRLTGNTLANSIVGNNGANVINGGTGADRMEGKGGNDTYYVDNTHDSAIEGASGGTADRVITTISYSLYTYVENLVATGSASVSLTGNTSANTIIGNAGSNRINGFNGNDLLYGYNGNDLLDGGTGNDHLNGGTYNDKLYGGTGNDKLYGGTGRDIFVFNTKPVKSINVDYLGDFSAPYDSIQLENAYFKKIGAGTATAPKLMSSAFFKIGTKATDTNDYIVYDKATGALSYDADGSGSGAAVLFARLKKGAALTHKDFYVI